MQLYNRGPSQDYPQFLPPGKPTRNCTGHTAPRVPQETRDESLPATCEAAMTSPGSAPEAIAPPHTTSRCNPRLYSIPAIKAALSESFPLYADDTESAETATLKMCGQYARHDTETAPPVPFPHAVATARQPSDNTPSAYDTRNFPRKLDNMVQSPTSNRSFLKKTLLRTPKRSGSC